MTAVQQAALLPFQQPDVGTSELVMVLSQISQQQQELLERMERLEDVHRVSLVKESYTVEEVAERANRRPFTVRQWCNKGQIKAEKIHGRGRQGEWRIPHEEVGRLQGEGPHPPGTYPNRSA